MTVEGEIYKAVYASSSNGSPYFFDIGADVYTDNGFTIVIWEEDRQKFNEHELNRYVNWSNSDEPLVGAVRVSGTIETYDGRPEIVARHGSQITCDIEDDGHWYSLISESEPDTLHEQYFR